ncbi:hypothetical protein JR316_0002723 [Psilocybe cubensis]|uniref:Uncharacterized protein n=1 Tax=Psilocybe cubensis TaxID=181762 RepID=A0ACB8HCS7_PSICU|nr:hypothetical protein JR316_0002723 [Psilocybe cubensis]KAH9485808.1 hypothetical protein JR316_0002723 [Psilocybe cubensis]
MQNISHQSKFHYDEYFFPFHQLTTLAIYTEHPVTYITIQEFFTILTKGQNLQDLRVRCIGVQLQFPDPHSGETKNLTDISHHRLQTLYIAVVNDGYLIDPLLQQANFPSLKNFGIGSSTGSRAWSHAAISYFLDRTSQGIQEIRIVTPGIEWPEVSQYFLYTPNATQVFVAAHGLTNDEFWQATDYLPRLEHLELEGDFYISPRAFTEFITQRCERYPRHDDTEVALLRSLSMRCWGETSMFVDADILVMLQQYREKGTDINIVIETDYRYISSATLLSYME